MKNTRARYAAALFCCICICIALVATPAFAKDAAPSGTKLVSARSFFQPIGRDYGVVIKLSGDGAKSFAEKVASLASSSGAAVSTSGSWFGGNIVVTARGLRRDQQAELMTLAHTAH